MVYKIWLHGCDDSTGFEMELLESELELLIKVAKLSEETSEYGCMPTMAIENKEGNVIS